jgi:hypothetical protein
MACIDYTLDALVGMVHLINSHFTPSDDTDFIILSEKIADFITSLCDTTLIHPVFISFPLKASESLNIVIK